MKFQENYPENLKIIKIKQLPIIYDKKLALLRPNFSQKLFVYKP